MSLIPRRRQLGAAFTLAVAALTLATPALASPNVESGSARTAVQADPTAPAAVQGQVAPATPAPAAEDAAGQATTAAATISGAMVSGQGMTATQTLRSPDGRMRMTLEGGALKVTRDGKVTYRSNTIIPGRDSSRDWLAVQGDGNVVIYGPDNRAVWHTRTHGQGRVTLRMQNDGDLVLTRASTGKVLWRTGITADAARLSTGSLVAGMDLFSPDGTKKLSMQGDGNLVLYQNGRPLWSTGTRVPGSKLTMTSKGVGLFTPDNTQLWGTPKASGGALVLQDNGNVVYYSSGTIVWHRWLTVASCDWVSGPITAEQVTTAANGITVHPCARQAMNAMVADAARSGVTLRGGGWRDMNKQIDLRKQNCGTTWWAIWQKPSSQCTPPTAIPGRSMHERGLAVDFRSSSGSMTKSTKEFRWLAANASRYGFKNFAPEPWHWSTNGS